MIFKEHDIRHFHRRGVTVNIRDTLEEFTDQENFNQEQIIEDTYDRFNALSANVGRIFLYPYSYTAICNVIEENLIIEERDNIIPQQLYVEERLEFVDRPLAIEQAPNRFPVNRYTDMSLAARNIAVHSEINYLFREMEEFFTRKIGELATNIHSSLESYNVPHT